MRQPTEKQIATLCESLASPQVRTKYGAAAREIRRVSEKHPALLYCRFDFFDRLMHDENRIQRWNATRILGYLARVDSEGQIDRILDRYLATIHGPELIAAANAIQGAADIACANRTSRAASPANSSR